MDLFKTFHFIAKLSDRRWAYRCGAGGEPSTWFSPGRLVELSRTKRQSKQNHKANKHTDTNKHTKMGRGGQGRGGGARMGRRGEREGKARRVYR